MDDDDDDDNKDAPWTLVTIIELDKEGNYTHSEWEWKEFPFPLCRPSEEICKSKGRKGVTSSLFHPPWPMWLSGRSADFE